MTVEYRTIRDATEACGDRSYYYCEEDDTVYSEYLSIGD